MKEALQNIIRECNLIILNWQKNSLDKVGRYPYITTAEIKGLLLNKLKKILLASSTTKTSMWRIKNDLQKVLEVKLNCKQMISSVYIREDFEKGFLKELSSELALLNYIELDPTYIQEDVNISKNSFEIIDFNEIKNIKF